MQIAAAKTSFHDLEASLIRSGMAASEIAEFFETVQSNDFTFDNSIRKWMPKLAICSDRADENDSPPIIHVGSQSSQSQLFGPKWTRKFGQEIRTPDPVLERNAAAGYLKALRDNAYYGYASTPVTFDCCTVDVSFERLIVSLKLPTAPERRVLAYFGYIQDIERRMAA